MLCQHIDLKLHMMHIYIATVIARMMVGFGSRTWIAVFLIDIHFEIVKLTNSQRPNSRVYLIYRSLTESEFVVNDLFPYAGLHRGCIVSTTISLG